jgi:hypothetical protein
MQKMFEEGFQPTYLVSIASEYTPHLHVWKITGTVQPEAPPGTYDCIEACLKDESGALVGAIKLDAIEVE